MRLKSVSLIAIDVGVGRSCQSVEKSERGNCQQHAGLLRQVAMGGGGHSCLLFKAEANVFDPDLLHGVGSFRHGNAHKAINAVEAESFKVWARIYMPVTCPGKEGFAGVLEFVLVLSIRYGN